ncbi:hypothetical protein DFH06DRAFT_1147255 [Mycena polygramma]|nr:hypothetical protein DFH06DRAFT_1147255 [Mycena polygramma]
MPRRLDGVGECRSGPSAVKRTTCRRGEATGRAERSAKGPTASTPRYQRLRAREEERRESGGKTRNAELGERDGGVYIYEVCRDVGALLTESSISDAATGAPVERKLWDMEPKPEMLELTRIGSSGSGIHGRHTGTYHGVPEPPKGSETAEWAPGMVRSDHVIFWPKWTGLWGTSTVITGIHSIMYSIFCGLYGPLAAWGSNYKVFPRAKKIQVESILQHKVPGELWPITVLLEKPS